MNNFKSNPHNAEIHKIYPKKVKKTRLKTERYHTDSVFSLQVEHKLNELLTLIDS